MLPGFLVMPTVAVNAALSLLRDGSASVHGPDRVAVIVPMYEERVGAPACITSILAQRVPPAEVLISVNGGRDDTYAVVAHTLAHAGFVRRTRSLDPAGDAFVDHWRRPGGGDGRDPVVTVVDRLERTSKSDSVNDAVSRGHVRAERLVIVDGDTVLDERFVERLEAHFYRLRVTGRGAMRRVVIEDVALQSGNVTSHVAKDATRAARVISAARRAEYAFGSVLRRGQVTRVGEGSVLGRSRLFTVVGCGFAVRRDMLPLPVDTMTEDHDLTLLCQARPERQTWQSVEVLAERGFTLRAGGRDVALRHAIPDEIVEVRTTGGARFVDDALMWTVDPPHVDGYLGQVERWHGGAQQNVLVRLGRVVSANVAVAMWGALLENLLGIGLLVVLLASIALHLGNPSLGISPATLAIALVLDLTASSLVVALGLHRFHAARSLRHPWARALVGSLATVLPYTLLRYLSPVLYVASALQVVPDHLRRDRREPRRSGVAWERPSLRVRTLSHVLLPVGLAGGALGMTLLAAVAPSLAPIDVGAWRLTYGAAPLDIERHVLVSLSSHGSAAPADDTDGRLRSAYCDPSFTPLGRAGAAPARFGADGDPTRYVPLSGWQVVVLARLVPLIGLFDAAVDAYGVPPHLFLRVLLNESYLDPLAVGATDDHGLSQQNGDSLTMLRALATDARSPYANGRLFAGPFSVYDPDFSMCAGAAKLAWAVTHPDARSDEHAYALYINPVTGLRDGRLSDVHAPLTAVMMRLAPFVDVLADAFAAFADDPARLADRDREALALAVTVREGLPLEVAYRRTHEFVIRQRLPDHRHYERIVGQLFTPELAEHVP